MAQLVVLLLRDSSEKIPTPGQGRRKEVDMGPFTWWWEQH